MIQSLDQKILDLCTRFSHWLQRTTGLTNYFVAKIGIILVFANCVVEILNYFKPVLSRKSDMVMVVLASLVTIICTLRMIWLDQEDKNILAGEERARSRLTAWISISESPFWRLSWLALTCSDATLFVFSSHHKALDILGYGLSPGLAIFYYFTVVDPLPPGKSKVREWVESIAGVLWKPTTERA